MVISGISTNTEFFYYVQIVHDEVLSKWPAEVGLLQAFLLIRREQYPRNGYRILQRLEEETNPTSKNGKYWILVSSKKSQRNWLRPKSEDFSGQTSGVH
ncbi:hypothetical protein Q9966_010073 [Columba livia]|nr:hypothetical protein Q9966_010073 [Columba livia]